MSGLPASGKTTYCEAKAKEHGDIVIHRDEVRQHLRELLGSSDYFPCEPAQEYEFYMQYIRTAINASNKDIWIDQTTIGDAAAMKILRAIKEIIGSSNLNNFKIILEVLLTPLEICKERNAKREKLLRVPNETIESMNKHFHFSMRLAEELWINRISESEEDKI